MPIRSRRRRSRRSIRRRRWRSTSDFTFSFVGNVDTVALKPLVEKYLGGLPSTNRKETFKDNGGGPPKGVVEKVVHKGVEAKANTMRLSFVTDAPDLIARAVAALAEAIAA